MSEPSKNLDPLTTLGRQLRTKSRQRRTQLAGAAQTEQRPRRNDLLPALMLEYVRLSDVRPLAAKLRRLDPLHVREVANAIATLGFCDPLLIGADGELIDGEARFAAAGQLGLERAPCIRVGHLRPEELRTLRLAVNRLGEKGQWDLHALKIELEQLIVIDAPIDISGFGPDEIDTILLDHETGGLETGCLEPLQGRPQVSMPGDVFVLGPHRIACGDARDPETIGRLLKDDPPARLLLTDEPYNVRIAGNVSGGEHREFVMASGEMTDAEYLAFNLSWINAALPFLADGSVVATFIDWRGYPIVHAAAMSAALRPLNLVVWTKTNAGMGSLYRSQHELLPLFRKGDAAPVNNVNLGRKGRWRSNVWVYPGASSFGSDPRHGLKDHPTVKPTAMLKDAILDLTRRGDIVIDPFLGSGSTLLAAEAVGRVCRGMELDPTFLDLAIHRYQEATGQTAVLEQTGQKYESLCAARLGLAAS